MGLENGQMTTADFDEKVDAITDTLCAARPELKFERCDVNLQMLSMENINILLSFHTRIRCQVPDC